MSGPRDSTGYAVAAVYATIVKLMDFGFLFLGLLGCVAGIASLAIGFMANTDYSDLLIFCGGSALLVCLPTLMAWGFSYRLGRVIQMQKQMREDLDELLRRTKS